MIEGWVENNAFPQVWAVAEASR